MYGCPDWLHCWESSEEQHPHDLSWLNKLPWTQARGGTKQSDRYHADEQNQPQSRMQTQQVLMRR
jgi:hypothetical protein